MKARISPKIVQMKINKLKWSTCKNAYWLCKIYKSVYKQSAKCIWNYKCSRGNTFKQPIIKVYKTFHNDKNAA